MDVLRRIETCARQGRPDYSAIEAELEALRRVTLQRRKACLIAESSTVMTRVCQKALEALPLQLTVVDNGLTALERLQHEPFDVVIAGLELKELNGVALMAALRTARARNQDIPAVLITSKREAIPASAEFKAVILRDRNLADALFTKVSDILG